MSAVLYLGFVAATAILMLIPGPNVAVIVATSLRHGTRRGLISVAGTSTAMVLQLAVTVAGMTAALALLGHWFEWLRGIGAAYLIFLGIQQWQAPAPGPLPGNGPPPAPLAIYGRGLLVSLANPKTLLFYGTFLPQFVDAPTVAGAALPLHRLLLLAVTFLTLAAVLDSGWALLAGRARPMLARARQWSGRVAGTLLAGAGIGLMLTRRP